jgi:hypothetical protein
VTCIKVKVIERVIEDFGVRGKISNIRQKSKGGPLVIVDRFFEDWFRAGLRETLLGFQDFLSAFLRVSSGQG